ncbi:hypothetical protein C240_1599 [Enterococcus sp. 5H]|nr:hypothetical protein [Enterococcus sp. 5H]
MPAFLQSSFRYGKGGILIWHLEKTFYGAAQRQPINVKVATTKVDAV